MTKRISSIRKKDNSSNIAFLPSTVFVIPIPAIIAKYSKCISKATNIFRINLFIDYIPKQDTNHKQMN